MNAWHSLSEALASFAKPSAASHGALQAGNRAPRERWPRPRRLLGGHAPSLACLVFFLGTITAVL